MVRVFYREDKVVADVSGNVYIRDGDSRRKLTPDEIRELQNDKGQVDLEREPVMLQYPNDFNAALIQEFSEGVRKLRQLGEDHTPEVLKQQLREFSHFGSDGKFYTLPEYPEEAWYEVIVNACVHRSYGLKNMNIMVKMFDDRLVVESPGGFPPFVNPENIYTQHHPRNPKLMDALFYLDFVKCHNEGTRRIRDAMVRMSLPAPEFAQKEISAGYTAVRVTLRNSAKQRIEWVDSDVSKLIGEEASRSLNESEKRVVNYAAEQGQINVSDCFRILPNVKTWHSAKNILMGLVSKGILMDERNPDVKRDPHAHFKLRKSAELSKQPEQISR